MRGFTDHEHIDEAQLIHMNGRVYDYNLGRFLSVDPFIQEPGNSQSLNPYSYIMNNPLAGTDPSGYVSVGVGQMVSCGAGEKFCYTGDSKTPTSCYNVCVSKDSSEQQSAIGMDQQQQLAQEGNLAAEIGSQSQNAEARTDGSPSETELIGPIDRSLLGIDGGNAQDVFDNANQFFKNDLSYRGEEVEFVDKYAISIRNKEDHSEVYAPAVFDSFDAANSYAAQPAKGQGGSILMGYEKVWVNGYHYGGKSTIYRTSTFARGGYSGVENTIAVLAHESRHFIPGSYSRIVPHRTDKEYEAFLHASMSAIARYRELSGGR
ncbi:MAG: Uncharacterised protein [Pseudidiomarina mangrovi]|nr:MAG: Uncharacterised protein [Pseudidiomarina mangrovi]